MSEIETNGSKRLLLDLGRKKRKAIAELKQGIGPIADQVQAAAEQAAQKAGAGDKTVLPLVIVYRKRPRRRPTLLGQLLRGR